MDRCYRSVFFKLVGTIYPNFIKLHLSVHYLYFLSSTNFLFSRITLSSPLWRCNEVTKLRSLFCCGYVCCYTPQQNSAPSLCLLQGRPAFSDDKAFAMVKESSGTHFDPNVVQAFFSVSNDIINERDRINKKNSALLELVSIFIFSCFFCL